MTDLPIADDGIYVASVGAQTPVGRSALQAAAAVRCGISAYAEHPFMIDRFGEPMVVAMAGWIPAETPIEGRIVHLGAAALLDVLQQTNWRRPQDSIAVYVALSTTTLPEPAERKAVVAKIEELLRGEGFSTRSEVFAEGNATGVLAIQAAAERLRNGTEQTVVVLGADSILEPSRLDTLDAAGRLHSVNNSWGFTPGEGAGAVLLLTGRLACLHRLTPLARVSAVGVGTESNVLGTKPVCVGEGLTTAFRAALSESDTVHHSYCDLNGETYRADEFGFAVCRTRGGFDDAGSFTAPADCWGDVGAAGIPLQMCLATAGWARGYAKGQTVLCWSSSATSPLRGAVRMTHAGLPSKEA